MKTITIENQTKFDKLPKSFDDLTEIQIIGHLDNISKTPKNSYIYVSGSATIEHIYGSATIESVSGSATIKYVYGSATIESVFGSATIKYVYGSATIESVFGSATIKYVFGSAIIKYVSGSATIEHVYGSATIESVSGSAIIKYVYGSATIESVSGSATIEHVYGNVILKVLSSGVRVIKVEQEATIIYQACKGRPKEVTKTVSIIWKPKAKFTWNNFIDIYDVKVKADKVTLFKSVKNNYTDHYTGKIKHVIGTIIKCPDWDPDINRECGGGFHLSPSIDWCKKFGPGRYLKCEVNIKDIIVHPYPKYPYKIRCREFEILEEVFDN